MVAAGHQGQTQVGPAHDDDTLVRAFAGGDARAFEQLCVRHHAALYRFVRRLLGTQAGTQADAVLQDTWARAIEARHRWARQGASLRTWLFALAHHRAVDCLRRSGREVSIEPCNDGDSAPFDPAGPARVLWPTADADLPGAVATR